MCTSHGDPAIISPGILGLISLYINRYIGANDVTYANKKFTYAIDLKCACTEPSGVKQLDWWTPQGTGNIYIENPGFDFSITTLPCTGATSPYVRLPLKFHFTRTKRKGQIFIGIRSGPPRPDSTSIFIMMEAGEEIGYNSCNVNSQNIDIELPNNVQPKDFPSSTKGIPLNVRCFIDNKVTYRISSSSVLNPTEGVFANELTNQASGVAIQIIDANGQPVAANREHTVDVKGNTSTGLGLKARYYATNRPFAPGDVKSTIIVTFKMP